MKAIIEYPETQEDEEVDLDQLLEDGEVALSKLRSMLPLTRLNTLLTGHHMVHRLLILTTAPLDIVLLFLSLLQHARIAAPQQAL